MKTKRSEASILFVLIFFITLFLCMLFYLVFFTATRKQDMINNSYNSRQEILLAQNSRGTIYANDGTILAQTIISSDGSEKRDYPFKDKFAHVVGYSTRGKTGIESLANYYLINCNLPITERVPNEIAGAKNPGDNCYTTLSVELQETASKAIDTYKGAIIVTEVKTGRILALYSNPSFDPNTIVEDWDSYVKNDKKSVLFNRVTQGLYPPGSTFKIMTALEYIRENPLTYNDYSFNCNGSYSFEKAKIHCYHSMSHGNQNFTESFANSCNSSFANIGLSLDRDQFLDTLNKALFNNKLPVAFPYSQSSVTTENLSIEEMMQTSIGQGKTLMTPLHLNMITQAIANHGVMMKPYLIDSIKTADDVVVKEYLPSEYGNIMTENEADILSTMMFEVVKEGTGKRLSKLDFTVAGKTGSAEYNGVKGDSHAWFTGFAPAEDPEICVTIILEGAGSGGDYAVPMAKRIFEAYFTKD